eukprot:CAMPEP_0167784654 /NCGR_PEP_ID=MMETSP0111_2-20121227/7763_1 /TAXON_ID=91324 /ORGANISM="Lotharella globosa, Strain CCCM811" /LENGTH=91 /DNA_ID=CAMNT_0007675761 /DNA_START=443 /DNA_END=719 /DNA_ORIENTATION=+
MSRSTVARLRQHRVVAGVPILGKPDCEVRKPVKVSRSGADEQGAGVLAVLSRIVSDKVINDFLEIGVRDDDERGSAIDDREQPRPGEGMPE